MKIKIILIIAFLGLWMDVSGQNYLFQSGHSGLSTGVTLMTERIKRVDAFNVGVDYTISGRWSGGISRTFVPSSRRRDNEGIWSVNLSACLLKTENTNSTFSIPVFLGFSKADNATLVSAIGGGIAYMSRRTATQKTIPVVLVSYNSQNIKLFNEDGFVAISGELNMIFNNFRIAPSYTIGRDNSILALNIGLVLY
ncbi:MAG: hypothetical protein IPM42_07615 [Saprospiraceae bacterium]|nr:hypothetical protein [Saprospiraceae bacterium]